VGRRPAVKGHRQGWGQVRREAGEGGACGGDVKGSDKGRRVQWRWRQNQKIPEHGKTSRRSRALAQARPTCGHMVLFMKEGSHARRSRRPPSIGWMKKIH
jgi:hypothetical protein